MEVEPQGVQSVYHGLARRKTQQGDARRTVAPLEKYVRSLAETLVSLMLFLLLGRRGNPTDYNAKLSAMRASKKIENVESVDLGVQSRQRGISS